MVRGRFISIIQLKLKQSIFLNHVNIQAPKCQKARDFVSNSLFNTFHDILVLIHSFWQDFENEPCDSARLCSRRCPLEYAGGPAVYDIICGEDGKLYPSECIANCFNMVSKQCFVKTKGLRYIRCHQPYYSRFRENSSAPDCEF